MIRSHGSQLDQNVAHSSNKSANSISFGILLTWGAHVASNEIVSHDDGKYGNRSDKDRHWEENIDQVDHEPILVRSSQCCEDI